MKAKAFAVVFTTETGQRCVEYYDECPSGVKGKIYRRKVDLKSSEGKTNQPQDGSRSEPQGKRPNVTGFLGDVTEEDYAPASPVNYEPQDMASPTSAQGYAPRSPILAGEDDEESEPVAEHSDNRYSPRSPILAGYPADAPAPRGSNEYQPRSPISFNRMTDLLEECTPVLVEDDESADDSPRASPRYAPGHNPLPLGLAGHQFTIGEDGSLLSEDDVAEPALEYQSLSGFSNYTTPSMASPQSTNPNATPLVGTASPAAPRRGTNDVDPTAIAYRERQKRVDLQAQRTEVMLRLNTLLRELPIAVSEEVSQRLGMVLEFAEEHEYQRILERRREADRVKEEQKQALIRQIASATFQQKLALVTYPWNAPRLVRNVSLNNQMDVWIVVNQIEPRRPRTFRNGALFLSKTLQWERYNQNSDPGMNGISFSSGKYQYYKSMPHILYGSYYRFFDMTAVVIDPKDVLEGADVKIIDRPPK